MKSYFYDHQSYDRAQTFLNKVNKAIAEEDSPTYVSGFIDADINDKMKTTSQYYLCLIIRRIDFEICFPNSGNILFTSRIEPSSSNSDHNLKVIYTSNKTLERSEYYRRRSKFIFTLDYVCILLLILFSPTFQIYYFLFSDCKI